MWRERHGRRDQVFFNFWSHVAAQFPCDPWIFCLRSIFCFLKLLHLNCCF
jgi:hypothetical protein